MTAIDAVLELDISRDEFIEIVCADELLLRAEFDSIIAEAWQSPPQPPRPILPAGGRPRRPGRPTSHLAGGLVAMRPFRRDGRQLRRQRSPPTWHGELE